MKLLHLLRPKSGKETPFLILISFLITFVISRFVINFFPSSFYLKIRGVHIHHFAYGIILLVLTGYYLLTQPHSPKTHLKLTILYGIAVGLAFDEFGMWIELENVYYNRASFDAVVIVFLTLLNIVYFEDFWKKWGYRLGQLLKRLFT